MKDRVLSSVALPLPAVVGVPYGVYFRSTTRNLPSRAELRVMVCDWLRRHASGDLQRSALAAVEERLVAFEVLPKAELLPSPLALHCCERKILGREGERLFARATHCVRIRTANSLLSPWVHLWAGLGAGRGIAAAMEGILYDHGSVRFLHPGTYCQRMPADPRLGVVQHLRVLHSVGDRGLGWVTTKGMEKFGLPNLEFLGVPPHLNPDVGRAMNGVAQRITCAFADLLRRLRTPPPALSLEAELVVRPEDVAAAYAPAALPWAEKPRGPAPVRIEYSGRGRDSMEPFITLRPPGAFERNEGVWLYELVESLLGMPEDRCVHSCGRHGELAEAHRRAVARLEEVRRRFQDGLRPGEVLFVKLGFPAEKLTEYMWVAVNTWIGKRLQGQLANEPEWRKDLRAGDAIELDQSEIFDWELLRGDGRRDGGYTTAVLLGKPLPE